MVTMNTPTEPEPAPAQTAREWLYKKRNEGFIGQPYEWVNRAMEWAAALADRADRAEAERSLAIQALERIGTCDDELEKVKAERDRLREALEWLEDEAPVIAHDAWSCSVDMGGNHWTLQFRNNGKRERIRGRTLIETIDKARAALNQTKQ